MIVNTFLRFFFIFFQKVLYPLCANGSQVFRPIPLYIIYIIQESKDLYLSPFSIYIIQYHAYQCQAFLCKMPGKFTGRKFLPSVKYSATFLYTMPGNSTFCTNQARNFRHRHFHQKSGMVFVQFDETPFPGLGFFYRRLITGVKSIVYIYSIYSTS